MRCAKRILVVALLTGLVTLGVYLVLSSREPTYQGKRVDRWLDGLAETLQQVQASPTKTRDPKLRDGARTALMAIGPKAIPYIVRRLKQTESPWHHKYREAYPEWPAWVKKILPQPEPELADYEGGQAFLYIGPSVEPQLVPLLDNDSVTVRTAAAFALGSLTHYDKTDIRNALAGLSKTAGDADPELRFMSAEALGNIGPDAASAVGVLTRGLKGSEQGNAGRRAYVRAAMARALGKIGPKSKEALPTLREFMTDSDLYLRVVSAVAVWRIDGDVTNTLPVLEEGLDKVNSNSAWEVLEGIAEMGPRAKEAAPVLTNFLDKGTFGNGDKVAEALKKINSEATNK